MSLFPNSARMVNSQGSSKPDDSEWFGYNNFDPNYFDFNASYNGMSNSLHNVMNSPLPILTSTDRNLNTIFSPLMDSHFDNYNPSSSS